MGEWGAGGQTGEEREVSCTVFLRSGTAWAVFINTDALLLLLLLLRGTSAIMTAANQSAASRGMTN